MFLQMERNSLWFKYAVILCDLYIRFNQYDNSNNVMIYIEDNKINQRLQHKHITPHIISKYYSCNIRHLLQAISTHKNVNDYQTRSELLKLYNDSVAICDPHLDRYEFFLIFVDYFRKFLLLNEYQKCSRYLQIACELFYNEYIYREYDIYMDNINQILLEYNLILYVLLCGTNNWNWSMFNNFQCVNHHRFEYRSLYQSPEYFCLGIYDLCHQFGSEYLEIVHSLFTHHDHKSIQKLLHLNTNRNQIDHYLIQLSIQTIMK